MRKALVVVGGLLLLAAAGCNPQDAGHPMGEPTWRVVRSPLSGTCYELRDSGIVDMATSALGNQIECPPNVHTEHFSRTPRNG